LLEPGDFQENVSLTLFGLDPAAVADFEDAKSGPITGVAPSDYPIKQMPLD
jgi:hypothetical protein